MEAVHTPVHGLIEELAEEDAAQQTVNQMMYQRSALYQRSLDACLARDNGFVVQTRPGVFEIRFRKSA